LKYKLSNIESIIGNNKVNSSTMFKKLDKINKSIFKGDITTINTDLININNIIL
jgi:hypothetical protein